MKERYSNNSIIFKTPPQDWWQGFLSGNGSGGATVWNPEDSLAFQLGHTDLLDRSFDPTIDTRGIPNVRHNLRGRLRIHGEPLFSPFYLKEYEAVTDLKTGITTIRGNSPFGRFEAEFCYCKNPALFLLRYREVSEEPLMRSMELEKHGSRFFARTWTGSVPDPAMGIGKTDWENSGDVFALSHQKEDFCLADLILLRSNAAHTDHIGMYTAERIFEPAKEFELEIRICPGLGKDLKTCQREAERIYAEAEQYTFEELLRMKKEEYAAELPDSHICLPEDPYYENLWYACRHYMRSCYQGYYPAFFINGPFGGDRDKREWADCWLHWNLHDSHLGIIKNGDWDLFHAFIEYKMRQIPSAKELARKQYGCGGMTTQDQQKPDGGSRGIEEDYYKLQLFPCLHTSLIFYQYWRFTGDISFLKEKLLPYLTLTLEFWKDYLVEQDGVLHVPRSSPYEFCSGYSFRDCLTELSMLRACLSLLPELEQAAHAPSALGEWSRDALAKLADFTSLPVLKDFVTREEDGKRIYDNPFFYGEPWKEDDEVYAIGFSERVHQYVTHSHTHAEIHEPDVAAHGGYGAFCSSQTSYIYPAGLVNSDASPEWREKLGTDQKQEKLWENGLNALRTIRRYPGNGAPGAYPMPYADTLAWTGHSLELPAFAKLGLKEPLEKALTFYIQNYQMFPQGMFNYHPRSRWQLACQDYLTEDGRQARVYFDKLCKHFSFEEDGIFTETIDLMLLDSSGGLIRTFPCYDKDAQFRLPAELGLTVEAMQKGGQVRYLKITGKYPVPCRVRTDWEHCFLHTGERVEELPVCQAVVSFRAKPGEIYLLTPSPLAENLPDLKGHSAGPLKNGPVCLGMFPSF